MSTSFDSMPWEEFGVRPDEVAVIIIDHGSRRAASNDLLLHVVDQFARLARFSIVEPAHMELAQPSLEDAFRRCVEQGAKLVIVHPYFLLPGRHWDSDIPRLAEAAAAKHAGVKYIVTAPLGLHPLMSQVIQARIGQCLLHAAGTQEACDLCRGTDKCQVQ